MKTLEQTETFDAPQIFSETLPEKDRYLEWLLPIIFCTVLFGQLLLCMVSLSPTVDESTHLYAGYLNWNCADYRFSSEHPPLARLVGALPLLSMHLQHALSGCGDAVNTRQSSLQFVYSNNAESLLFRARAAVSLFSIALCAFVWIFARTMFGVGVATFTTGLLVFEPNVLAHGGLVTNDIALTTTLLLSVLAFYLWITRHSVKFLLLTGVAVGLTLTAKMSGVLVIPILCLLALVELTCQRGDVWRAALRYCGALLLIGCLAVTVLWAVYGFHYASAPQQSVIAAVESGGSISSSIKVVAQKLHLLPESYLAGLGTAGSMSGGGRPTFLLGRLYEHGRWFYFPVAFAIKLTAATLMLLTLAFFGAKSLLKIKRRELVFLLLPMAVILFASMRSLLNIGFRHVLPIVPFLLIFTAAGCVQLARQFPIVGKVLMLAFAAHALSSAHALPDYLSYSNEFWGGSGSTYKYLTDSNTDWGQAMKEVDSYAKAHPNEPCWLAQLPFVPEYYETTCKRFGISSEEVPAKVHGTVIISSVFLSGVLREVGIPVMKPFADLKPQDRIGGSAMLVYKGDFDMSIPAGISEAILAGNLREAGELQKSIEHGRRSVELIPDATIAHAELCRSLAAAGDSESAIAECKVAITKLNNDPICTKCGRASIEDAYSRAVSQRSVRLSALPPGYLRSFESSGVLRQSVQQRAVRFGVNNSDGIQFRSNSVLSRYIDTPLRGVTSGVQRDFGLP